MEESEMKMDYQKPDMEYISFLEEEELMGDEFPDPELGTSELPEGWE